MNPHFESKNEEYDIQTMTQESAEPFVNNNDSFMFRMNNSQIFQTDEITPSTQHMNIIKMEQNMFHPTGDESPSCVTINELHSTYKKRSSVSMNESVGPLIINSSFYQVGSRRELQNTARSYNPQMMINFSNCIKNVCDQLGSTPSQDIDKNDQGEYEEPKQDLKKEEIKIPLPESSPTVKGFLLKNLHLSTLGKGLRSRIYTIGLAQKEFKAGTSPRFFYFQHLLRKAVNVWKIKKM